MKSKRRKPRYIPVRVTGKLDGIRIRPFVSGLIFVVLLLLIVCSACRLATPDFNTGAQTNSVGEVWYPPKGSK